MKRSKRVEAKGESSKKFLKLIREGCVKGVGCRAPSDDESHWAMKARHQF